jgi:GNAT superfamily N-acetyltransferase
MRRDYPSALVHEVERALYEASSAWEGIDAQEIPLGVGEVVLRIQPGFAAAMPLRFETGAVEAQLDDAIERVERMVPWCLWVIGPNSCPIDLEQHLVARGFAVRMEWEGLVLEDLAISIPLTPDLAIEPLSWDNAQAYAAALAGGTAPPRYAELLAQAYRFLGRSPQEVQIYLARMKGEVAGYAVLRLEANGVAYLRNALTVPAFRSRGVYLSLVAHRLTVAQAAGCTVAVLQAQTRTSAPILIKRGFKSVCRMIGLARKQPGSTGNG